MKTYQKLFIEVIFSLFSSMLFLFFTKSLYFSIIVFTLFLFSIMAIANYFSKRHDFKLKYFTNEKEFILNFLLYYKNEESINSCLEKVKKYVNPEVAERIDSIDDFNELEKIIYLKNYFNSKTFDLFVHDFSDGKNVKAIKLRNKYLEIYGVKEKEMDYNMKQSINTIIECLFVWISIFTIFGFTSLFFVDFYKTISENSYFDIGILVVFLLFLTNVLLNIKNYYFDNNLEGGAIYEKVKSSDQKSKFAIQKRDK